MFFGIAEKILFIFYLAYYFSVTLIFSKLGRLVHKTEEAIVRRPLASSIVKRVFCHAKIEFLQLAKQSRFFDVLAHALSWSKFNTVILILFNRSVNLISFQVYLNQFFFS